MRSELSTFSCSQIKMARASLNWSIERLSQNSGVSISTIKRIETEPGFLKATDLNIQMIKKTFETAGVEFIGTPEDGPGIRLWSPVRKF